MFISTLAVFIALMSSSNDKLKMREELLRKYINVLRNTNELVKKRKSLINKHFYIANIKPAEEKPTIENKIQDILGKEVNHPSVFLASALGFTKSNWSKTIERLLIEIGLTERIKCPSYKNMVKFEKLKLLIFKYLELKKMQSS